MKTAKRTYHLHQIFICARSGNIGSLCKLEAAEDGWLQGSLDLRYEDPEATDCMLQYLYEEVHRGNAITSLPLIPADQLFLARHVQNPLIVQLSPDAPMPFCRSGRTLDDVGHYPVC